MENRTSNTITCKYCGSSTVSKYGKYGGTQLYWCKVCKRKFKADDALFGMHVSPEYIARALDMYYTGGSINDICEHFRNADGYYPSKSVVFGWIDKFTDKAVKHFSQFQPKVGTEWQCDETVLRLDKKRKVWLWDIIDSKSKYLICTRESDTRTTKDAALLMDKSKRITGISPKQITSDQLRAYWDGIELTFGSETEHRQGGPFKGKDTGESTSQIERFHSTIKERTKVMKSFRTVDSLIQFMDGFLVWYNYLKPHHSLGGKTPAEAAGIDYNVKNWQAVCQLPVTENEAISEIPEVATPTSVVRTMKQKPIKRVKRREIVPTSLGRIRQ